MHLWSRAPGVNGAVLFGYLGTIGVFTLLVAYILTNVGAIRFFVARRLWTWQWIVPGVAILALGYTLCSNLYPVPSPRTTSSPTWRWPGWWRGR
jgi:amino acid transporter